MQVWAHTPVALTYDDMLALGVDSLEHLWPTQYSLMDARPIRRYHVSTRGMVGAVEDARMSDLARRTVEAGLWNVPTLTIHTQLFEYAANAEEFFGRPEMKYVGQAVIQMWRGSEGPMASAAEGMRGATRPRAMGQSAVRRWRWSPGGHGHTKSFYRPRIFLS